MSGRSSASAFRVAALASLEAEILEERASALGRAGRRLQNAMARLRAFDEGTPLPPLFGNLRSSPKPSRPALVAAAREALWFLVVQREACGLRGTDEVLAAYGVPKEVSAFVMAERVAWRKGR